MIGPLPLRAALRRGALVTAANWPVVFVEFAIESVFMIALAVPVVGGALMAASLVGADVNEVLGEGVRSTADVVFAFLTSTPGALASFLVALGVVALGGEVLMFIVKSCTFMVLVQGERQMPDVEDAPLDLDVIRQSHAFTLERLLVAGERFWRRAAALALSLGGGYVVVGASYVAVVALGMSSSYVGGAIGAWPLLLLVATSAGVVGVTIINLAYDLVRVIVITDDCSVADAIARLRRFVIDDARQVIGIFAVMSTVGMLAAAVAILATAGTTLVGSLPFLGLLLVPLQAATWLVRGLLFQYLSLASLSAYQAQYRRFGDRRAWTPSRPAPEVTTAP